ncbi:hypothetical protein [Mycobacterium sp. NPDC004974]
MLTIHTDECHRADNGATGTTVAALPSRRRRVVAFCAMCNDPRINADLRQGLKGQ